MPSPQTHDHTDLAWKFLLVTRTQLRPDLDDQDRKIVRRITFQYVADLKLALVVLVIARMNDTTPGKLITRHMVRDIGVSAAAVNHAFHVLLHDLPPVGSDRTGVAFEPGKVGRAVGLRITTAPVAGAI